VSPSADGEDGVGATAVQIVCSYHRGTRDIEHIGSAHDGAELELLKAAARQRLAAGQGELGGRGCPGSRSPAADRGQQPWPGAELIMAGPAHRY